MLIESLIMGVITGSMWWLARLGKPNTRIWLLRVFFFKWAFYISLFAPMVSARMLRIAEFGEHLLFSALIAAVLIAHIAVPATIIYYFRTVRKHTNFDQHQASVKREVDEFIAPATNERGEINRLDTQGAASKKNRWLPRFYTFTRTWLANNAAKAVLIVLCISQFATLVILFRVSDQAEEGLYMSEEALGRTSDLDDSVSALGSDLSSLRSDVSLVEMRVSELE